MSQVLQCDLLLVAAALLGASWCGLRRRTALAMRLGQSSFERLERSSLALAPLQGSGLRPSTP